jgi:hypothetical protein
MRAADVPPATPYAFIDTADIGRLTNLFGIGCARKVSVGRPHKT